MSKSILHESVSSKGLKMGNNLITAKTIREFVTASVVAEATIAQKVNGYTMAVYINKQKRLLRSHAKKISRIFKTTDAAINFAKDMGITRVVVKLDDKQISSA